MNNQQRRYIGWVHGHVQGVGFRWCTRVHALEQGLVGYVKNYPDGRVLVIAEGKEHSLQALDQWLKNEHPRGRVDLVVSDYSEPRGCYDSFDIR